MPGVPRSLLLGLALALATALPASAATWSSPAALSTAGTTTAPSPSVALDDAGFGVAAWSESASGASVIRTAVHAPGGSWATLATPASNGLTGLNCTPQVSIDPAGNALAVWAHWTTGGCGGAQVSSQTIFWSTLAVGTSTWSAPAQLGNTAEGDDFATMSTASNALGQMVLAFANKDATNRHVFGALGSPTGGFGQPVEVATLPVADLAQGLATGIGPAGDAAVQWELDDSGNANVMVSIRPAGGAFQATPTAVTNVSSSTQGSATWNAVAVDGSGNVLSAYYFSDVTSNAPPDTFQSRYRPAGGSFGLQQRVSLPANGFVEGRIALAFDATGTATAAWTETDISGGGPSYDSRVFAATRPAGSTAQWSAEAPLTGVIPSPDQALHLAVAGSGAAVVAWDGGTTTNDEIVSYRPAAGAFGVASDLGQGSGSTQNGATILAPSAAIAPGGDALAGFAGSVANDARVAVLDVRAPAITAMAVPATVTLGQPAAMSMGASELWSGLGAGQPVWSFGDGSTATGVTSLTHSYAAVGIYTVTLAVVDGAGNASAPVTRQITVTGRPASPGGNDVIPLIAIATTKAKAAYVASRLKGSVTLVGSVPAAMTLRIAITRHGAKKALVSVKQAVKAGRWSRTVKLPQTTLPGRYDVTVGATGARGAASSFTIAAPKTGVADRVYASAVEHGPAVAKIATATMLWAHFHLAALPKKGRVLATQWILPSGSKLGANQRPRASLVEAQVKNLKGGTLPTGTWHCVLRAGGAIVATLTVRVA